MEQARRTVAADLVAEIRSLDARLKASTKAIAEAVKASGSTRPDTVGVGPIIAGRLISRTGRVSRFPTAAAYANYAGAAPVEIASADKSRHRLLGPGSPAQLGPAHHRDHPDPDDGQPRQPLLPGRITEGKTPREAQRCLKSRLANHVWRVMTADERTTSEAGPGGHTGATTKPSAAGQTPTASSSGQSPPEPAIPNTTTT